MIPILADVSEHERNKQALRDLLAAVDAGDVEKALSFYAPEYQDHDASEARSAHGSAVAGLRRAFALFQKSFSGTRHDIDILVAEGDLVACRISVESVHTGDMFGVPATREIIRNESLVIYRFEQGRIRERWCRERHSTRELLESAARRADAQRGG